MTIPTPVRTFVRLSIGGIAVALGIVLAVASAGASSAPKSAAATSLLSGSGSVATSAERAIASPVPAICPEARSVSVDVVGCGGGMPYAFPAQVAAAGVTATGQASVRGTGQAVRDEAIRQAIADAREQAEVAARTAGVQLGKVTGMQIFAPGGYAIPMQAGVASGPTKTGAGASGFSDAGDAVTGPPATVPSCAPGATCATPLPAPVPSAIPYPLQTFVTVTVTWSIA
jgi:Protein of unknown function (DUF541)